MMICSHVHALDPRTYDTRVKCAIVDGKVVALTTLQQRAEKDLVGKEVILITNCRHDVWVVGSYVEDKGWTVWRSFARPSSTQLMQPADDALGCLTYTEIEEKLLMRLTKGSVGILVHNDIDHAHIKFPTKLLSNDDSLLLRCQVKYLSDVVHQMGNIDSFYVVYNVGFEKRRVRLTPRNFMLLDLEGLLVMEVWVRFINGSHTVHFVGSWDRDHPVWRKYYNNPNESDEELGTFVVPNPDKFRFGNNVHVQKRRGV